MLRIEMKMDEYLQDLNKTVDRYWMDLSLEAKDKSI